MNDLEWLFNIKLSFRGLGSSGRGRQTTEWLSMPGWQCVFG